LIFVRLDSFSFAALLDLLIRARSDVIVLSSAVKTAFFIFKTLEEREELKLFNP
jgi:hypothetical protein